MKRLLLFAALIAWSGMSAAVVYKWVDAQGKVQYGDRPPDGVHAEVVEMPGNHAARSAPAAPAGSSSSGTTPKPSGTDSTKAAVDSDVAQTRDKQCADAQDRYKKLIEGRRLYKEGTNGERQYLTSDEIDAERVNAKRAVDEICNSST
ncbi:MAG TPA: DUF4124 domain-containing protein [Steroidobacteraceae bacterium]|jgi:hypothetical protein|nr:DUF4124 domain-containing protein [Steroidobacteraceae bacterium]